MVDQSLAEPITTPTSGAAGPSSCPLTSEPDPLAHRIDAQDDSLALDRPLVVVAGVAPRERVDVLTGGVAADLAVDRAAHLDVAVRVGGVPDRDGHVRVLLDRLVLRPVQLGV